MIPVAYVPIAVTHITEIPTGAIIALGIMCVFGLGCIIYMLTEMLKGK